MGLPLSSPQMPLPGSGEHLASEVLGPCGVGMCCRAGLCPYTQALRHRPMLRQGCSSRRMLRGDSPGATPLPAAAGRMLSLGCAPSLPCTLVSFPDCLDMPVTSITVSKRVS